MKSRVNDNQIQHLEGLVKMFYKREVELEGIIERLHFSRNLWFFKQTLDFNVQMGIHCLNKIDTIKKSNTLRYELH